MMAAHQNVNTGWPRLEAMLTDLKPSEAISIDALVAESGLPLGIVVTVLKELERVELFTRQDERVFVRRSAWPEAEVRKSEV
jgi:hypothetical protein